MHFVTQQLHLPQFAQHDRVAEMNVGRRRIEPQLDAQRPAARAALPELAQKLVFLDNGLRSLANDAPLFFRCYHVRALPEIKKSRSLPVAEDGREHHRGTTSIRRCLAASAFSRTDPDRQRS